MRRSIHSCSRPVLPGPSIPYLPSFYSSFFDPVRNRMKAGFWASILAFDSADALLPC